MVRKSEKKYYGVNIGLTPTQHKLLDKTREIVNNKLGVELSRAEIVQFLSHYYLNKEGHDNQA